MSITSQPFLIAVTALTLTSILAGVAAAGGFGRGLLARVGVAVSPLVPAAVYVAVSDPFHSSIPPSFYAWAAVPLACVPICVAAWRRRGVLPRLAAIVPVTAGLVFAGVNINAHYAYYPTLASVLGQRAHDEVADATRARLESTPATAVPSQGVVFPVVIPGTRSHFKARPAVVYLPPAWRMSPRPTLPVLLLLAGTPGSPWDWTRAGYADVIADEFAAQHAGRAPIIVMADPNGSWLADTECVDGKRARAETYLVADVRSFVVQRFGASSASRQWAVGGLSEGATCALVLALRHPTLFDTFVDLSGAAKPSATGNDVSDLFDGSRGRAATYDPGALLERRRYDRLAGWFESGASDHAAHDATAWLAPRLREDGASVCVVERAGSHNFVFWRDALRHALPWVAAREGLIDRSTTAVCEEASVRGQVKGQVKGQVRAG